MDVLKRLDEFRQLQNGWLYGHGIAPNSEGLDWLSSAFADNYRKDLPLPYAYPTESGGVRFEWSLRPAEAVLEIDLEKKTAWWFVFNSDTYFESGQIIDLSGPAGWERLAELFLGIDNTFR